MPAARTWTGTPEVALQQGSGCSACWGSARRCCSLPRTLIPARTRMLQPELPSVGFAAPTRAGLEADAACRALAFPRPLRTRCRRVRRLRRDAAGLRATRPRVPRAAVGWDALVQGGQEGTTRSELLLRGQRGHSLELAGELWTTAKGLLQPGLFQVIPNCQRC